MAGLNNPIISSSIKDNPMMEVIIEHTCLMYKVSSIEGLLAYIHAFWSIDE